MRSLSFPLIALVAAIGACLMEAERGHAQAVISGQSEIDRQAKTKATEELARRVDIDLRDATLGDLAKFVSERTGLNVLLDQKALEDSAVDPEQSTVSLRGKSLPLGGALDHALGQQELAWKIQHGALVITTKEENEQSGLEVQVYPVADLLDPTAPRPSHSEDLLETEPLVDLIVSTIAPDLWDEVGGPGAISLLHERSVLVVSQMREVHEGIERLLAALRAVPAAKPILRTAPARASARGSHAIGSPTVSRTHDENDTPARTFRRMTAMPRWLLPRTHE
jgi:hypothetical protein